MEKRCFGRSDHLSSIAIFGGAAFGKVDQAVADQTMELLLEYGVNHIDIAPSYGNAEERLAPWMPSHRDKFFIGCKTLERGKNGAKEEMRHSLKRLGLQHFDLYQLHAVNDFQKLDLATMSGGALEAVMQAKEEGLTRFIGITAHGIDAPDILLEALDRYDFDSVLFPVNFIQYAIPAYRQSAAELIRTCTDRNIGIMAIKSITKSPWDERTPAYHTWYEPFSGESEIQQAVSFVLSQDVTGICTAGDTRLLPQVLHACENFTRLSNQQQENLIQSAVRYKPLFPEK